MITPLEMHLRASVAKDSCVRSIYVVSSTLDVETTPSEKFTGYYNQKLG